MSKRLSGKDCFIKAAEFIGKDWLDEQVEKYRTSARNDSTPKLVQNYRRAQKELGYVEDEFASDFPSTSMPTADFINLGRYVMLLEASDACVIHPETHTVLDVPLADHFDDGLKNPRHYERTLYELQTGCLYAQEGYTVQFLDEGRSESKTPDILLRTPFQVFVECKRIDSVSGSVRKSKAIAQELNERVIRHLDPGHAAIFEYSANPEMDDIAGVTDALPSSTHGPVSVDLPFGTVVVRNLEEIFGKHNIWAVDSGNDVRSKYEELYGMYLQPIVEATLGDTLALSEVEHAMKTERIESPSRTEYRGLRFSCVPTRFDRNRISRIAGQVDKARKKFGKEHPNILHIDAPIRIEIAEEKADDLRSEIGRRLASTRRVTAVTISIPVKERGDAGAEAVRHKGASIEHIDPYTRLPNKFELLGENIT